MAQEITIYITYVADVKRWLIAQQQPKSTGALQPLRGNWRSVQRRCLILSRRAALPPMISSCSARLSPVTLRISRSGFSSPMS